LLKINNMETVTLHIAAITYDDRVEQAILYCIDGKPAHLMLEDGYEQTPDMVEYDAAEESFASINTMDSDELVHHLFCISERVWSWAY
jgi:hypothetical protein